MKMSLREKLWVQRVLWIFAMLMLFATPASLWCLLPAMVCLVIGAIFGIRQLRCPNCGKWIGRAYGEYCSRCGVKFDFDAK